MTAKAPVRRCAVYTRKSSEEGLEQDFNSLHAQREACEAFIRSQRGEGWRLMLTVSTVLGGSGVFLLYYSLMSAPLGDYGAVCLALASAIAWFVDRSAANTLARPRR